MVRGFAAGSLALIALYVFVQRGAADKVAGGSNLILSGVRRLLSGDVAGLPLRKTTTASSSGTSAAPNMTGGTAGMLTA